MTAQTTNDSLPSLNIIGAGGHAKVVLEAALKTHSIADIRIFDQDKDKTGGRFHLDLAIEYWEYPPLTGAIHLAIGHNDARRAIVSSLSKYHMQFLTITHERACLSDTAILAEGCFIAAQANIAAASSIGAHTIINHNANVDHDCRIGAFCHIAPGSTICGNVSVGDGTLVGANATLLPGVSVGEGSIVAAGAVIASNVAPFTLAYGVNSAKIAQKLSRPIR
ncbi:acetyltransferase [Cohaesibacter celericrescens]|uniref:Acetyltransferase n=1 Tax=Cohaesibacter celericrescens TaxID=2067669 RepID=A0A2N5XUP0_9HYPH|nr:acetyltransferase [Cohaesibacter celericrescens]PLW78138.1 acetyltransferase [Cohaesibacter celericrescens]